MFLGCNSKESGDECDLPSYIPFCHALHLPLPQHVHHLKSLQSPPCCLKREKAHSRLRQTLDTPMILFDQVVEVFDLSSFTAYGKVSFCFEFVERFRIGRIFVHVDDTRLRGMRGGKGFEKEGLRYVRISYRTEEEIERVSLRINRAVEIHPLLFDLDGGLINTPRISRRLHMRTTALLQFGCIALNESDRSSYGPR